MSDPVRLLIVDDIADIRAMLRLFAERDPGCVVLAEASNGEEAVTHVATVPPDVVILDVRMPVLDGIATIPRLRELAPDLPIVMFSSDPTRRAEALHLGATVWLDKSASLSEVIERAIELGKH